MRKKFIFYTFTLFICLTFFSAKNAASETDLLKQYSSAFNKVAENAIPAVVHISTEKTIKLKGYAYHPFFGIIEEDVFHRDFFQIPRREYKQHGLGSGVIVSKDGYILTNYHVLKGMDTITVTLSDKREFMAKVRGYDLRKDIALLKIQANNLSTIKFGDSNKIKVGDWAIAVGSPFGLAGSFTVGVISAKGRGNGDSHMEGFANLIQTDAAINPGNSGGALLNIDGEIIGINTAIVTKSGGYLGIGFAVPMNIAKKVMDDLLSGKKQDQGWFGVYIQDISKELIRELRLPVNKGVLVSGVIPNSPAEEAGIKHGDIIVKYDGKRIHFSDELKEMVKQSDIGKNIKVEIIRNNIKKIIKVKIIPVLNKGNLSIPGKSDFFGIKVENIENKQVGMYNLDDKSGVVITYLKPGSRADRKGVRVGDVILEINNKTINSLKDYNKVCSTIPSGDKAILLVKTIDYTKYIILKAN